MKEGYKKTELGWIPDEWEIKQLKNLGESIIGLTYSPDNLVDEEGTLVLRSSNIKGNRLSFNDNKYVNKKIPDKLITKENDILVCSRNGSKDLIGKCALIDKNSVGNSFGAFMTIYRGEYNQFLFQVFNSFMLKRQIYNNLGATINQITTDNLNKFKVPFPPLKEQQKIAEILSTVDTQIDDTDKLIEKTKELKKGLMQRLLTKGIGHTEFKITEVGEIPVEWEIITVGKLVTLLKSGLSRSLKEENVGVPCIRSNNIKEDKLVLNDLKYWYNMDDKGAKIEDYILDEGDIIVNFINSISQIGKGCIFNKNDFRTIYTTNLLRIKVDNSKIINTFFYYYIQTERYRKEITLITKPAVNQASFTTVEYKSIKFPVPNLEEQRLISNILVSVDTQIEEYENKKSKLEELKKGLMQKLLTGKIRVV